VTADINAVATAVETFVRGYRGSNVTAKDVQVRPSGDDIDVIKVWVDLGTTDLDPHAWATTCETAIKQAVAGATAFKIAVRAEAGV
jgi:hypothetical protein